MRPCKITSSILKLATNAFNTCSPVEPSPGTRVRASICKGGETDETVLQVPGGSEPKRLVTIYYLKNSLRPTQGLPVTLANEVSLTPGTLPR